MTIDPNSFVKDVSPWSGYEKIFLANSASAGEPVFYLPRLHGPILKGVDAHQAIAKFFDKYKIVYRYPEVPKIKKKYSNTTYMRWDSHVLVNVSVDINGLTMEAMTHSQEDVDELFRFLTSVTDDGPEPSSIRMMVKDYSGYVFQVVGSETTKLERTNYSASTLVGLDAIQASLTQENPKGRISILEGEPGTGKTHMLRGLIAGTVGPVFVLVSPALIEAAQGPEAIKSFIDLRNEFKTPIVLIVEDADECLVPREHCNLSTISALLNLTDGIIGSILDLRIICTTNAKMDEIDPAIMRPGRLCERVEVGRLSADEANVVHNRIKGEELNPYRANTFHTLAEVYAGTSEGAVEKKPGRRVGFAV